MRKYYFKATRDGGVSGYDPNFVHKLGHNVHPHPDRNPLVVCGQGVHLGKTITGALSFVKDATEVYLATSTDIIAQDEEKVRVGEYDILYRIPSNVIKEYQPKWDALYKEYQPKRDILDKEYQPKWDILHKEYQPKLDILDKEYQSKRDALDKKTLSKILKLYAYEDA